MAPHGVAEMSAQAMNEAERSVRHFRRATDTPFNLVLEARK